MPVASKANRNDHQFEEVAEAILQRVRRALTRMIHSIPGENVTRPAQLAEALDLDTGLAWKLSKAIGGDDPFHAAQHLPGTRGLHILLRAAKRHHVPQEFLTDAEEAFGELRQFVRVHAGDRKSFNMLMAGQTRTKRAEADLVHRRGAFENLSYVFGVHAKTQIRTYILQPSADERSIDVASIVGFVDVRRIRASVPWRITRLHTIDRSGRLRTAFDRHPLDDVAPDNTGPALPVMSQFCSDPLPSFRTVVRNNGLVDYLLDDERLGNSGLFTCATGEVVRSAEPRYRDEALRDMDALARVRTPCATLQFDLLVHNDLFGPIEPIASVYSDVFTREATEGFDECDRMPLHEKPESLGMGTTGLFVANVPRYAEMIEYAFDRLRWDARHFEAHRLTIAFPPIPSTVILSHPLPAPPA